ncbi:MAG: restriction endonuclease subunit S [Candidatus Paceibacteria bacterium]
MQKKLSELSDIVSGYTFRGSIENDPNGDIFVLQAKNIQTNQDIVGVTDFTTITDKSLRNPYFLQHNDILLVSRGSGPGSFRSAVFVSDESKVMPSSSVHVIRIQDVTVLPKYVSLYLNSETGQKELLQIVTGGSYIQSILIKNLIDFKIPIPPIHIQKSIIALHENIKAQDKILERKKQLKQNIINSTFINIIKK